MMREPRFSDATWTGERDHALARPDEAIERFEIFSTPEERAVLHRSQGDCNDYWRVLPGKSSTAAMN